MLLAGLVRLFLSAAILPHFKITSGIKTCYAGFGHLVNFDFQLLKVFLAPDLRFWSHLDPGFIHFS